MTATLRSLDPTSWWASLSLALATVGCEEPAFSHEGVHVRVSAVDGAKLCAGTMAHMDRFVELTAAEFGLPPPVGAERIRFFWFDDADYFALSPCGSSTAGCASGDTVYSRYAPHDHELVHAVASVLTHPAHLFTEGLATAYEGLDDSDSDREWVPGQIEDEVDVKEALSLDYDIAGSFVAYLIGVNGIEAFLRAYAAIPRRAPIETIDEMFRKEFGRSLDDTVADYYADAPRCGPRGYVAKLAECDAPALPWDGVRGTWWFEPSCDAPDAIGPYEGGTVQLLRTVEIDESGDYTLTLVADNPIGTHAVSLDACARCSGPGLTVRHRERATVSLSAGRHALRIRGATSSSSRVGVVLERVMPETPP